MNLDGAKSVSEIAKNTSEAAKNFHSIMDGILQPRGLDLAILEGHKKIIQNAVDGKGIDYEVMAFLSQYKKSIKEYRNCKRVVELAASMVAEDSKAKEVEGDWYDYFFDKVRLISDESVQALWARILAQEVNNPNTLQRSLLHVLSVMSKSQADLFCNIARFCMYEYKNEDVVHPLIFISVNAD